MCADGRVTLLGGGFVKVDHEAYLSQHDVVYETPALIGSDGLPLGNGDMGALFWMPTDGPRWELGKCDLWDDGPERPFGSWNKEDEEVATALRSAGSLSIRTGLPALDWMYLSEFHARLELHPARATLRAVTPFSMLEIETWTNRDPVCLVVSYRDALEEPLPRRIALERWGSRVFAHWYRTIVRDPRLGLGGTASGADGAHIWIVQQTRSHRFAVAAALDGIDATPAREHHRAARFTTEPLKEAEFRLYVSVVSSEDANDPLAEALRRTDAARAEGAGPLRARHRRWWAGFWEKSFVHLPDAYLENLWYLNHYLMGSGSLGSYPPHFINGIWNWNRDVRAWNHYYHWNQEELNWPVWAAGHPELAYGYLRMRRAALPLAMASAKRRGRAGAQYSDVFERRGWQDEGVPLFTPGLQVALDMWRYWRHTGDERFLKDVAWPLMREACRFYLDMLEKGDDGRYHLPASHPYEHASGYMVRDCLTDLAHVRTAFPATAAVAERMGRAAFAAKLREVAAKLPEVELIPIPAHYLKESADGQVFAAGWSAGKKPTFDRMLCVGRRVDDDRPVYLRADREGIGRDWLFPGSDESLVYPSGAVGLKDRGTELFRAAQNTALANWDEFMGWSVSPIVFARLGMAEHVADALRRHILHFQHFPQGFWNYQGSQDGLATNLAVTANVSDRFDELDTFPFPQQPHAHFGLEPGAVVQAAINEMFLQSYDGAIRICPAVPKDWDGAFALWAEGGFRVSAHVEAGRAREVVVESLRGEECRLIPDPDGAPPAGWAVVDAASGKSVPAKAEGDALVFGTEAGHVYRASSGEADRRPKEVFTGARAQHAKQCGKRWIGIPRKW